MCKLYHNQNNAKPAASSALCYFGNAVSASVYFVILQNHIIYKVFTPQKPRKRAAASDSLIFRTNRVFGRVGVKAK